MHWHGNARCFFQTFFKCCGILLLPPGFRWQKCKCSTLTGFFFRKKDPSRVIQYNDIVLTSESRFCYSADCWNVYRRKYLSLLGMFLYSFPGHSLLPKISSGINCLDWMKDTLSYFSFKVVIASWGSACSWKSVLMSTVDFLYKQFVSDLQTLFGCRSQWRTHGIMVVAFLNPQNHSIVNF